MKKIGILTLYHNNHNYGGLLQSYALWKTVDSISQKNFAESYVKQISYVQESGYKKNPQISRKQSNAFKELGRKIKYGLKYYNEVQRRWSLLTDFEYSIPHTDVVTAQTISKLNDEFDTFICGSDQIWNPMGWQDTYFLSFVKPGHKKFAYAASMARDHFTKEEADYALKMMAGFDAVSLREEQSVKALQEYDSSFQAEVMPDPTLLLTTEDWNQVAQESRREIGEPYIFAYFLGSDNKQKDESINYAKKVGKKIYFVGYLNLQNHKWENDHSDYMLDHVTVPDFLRLIRDADLVITDSFHGAVFSAIYHTDFVVMNRFKSGEKESMNSRIDTLMKTFGINKVINNLNFEKDYKLKSSEIKNIEVSLKEQRLKGKKFLSHLF
jgi:hypothetical protein